jgi:ArsR family transcriptional regulator, arsenate/arsenite/antimonite-responsive transcriptional repressor
VDISVNPYIIGTVKSSSKPYDLALLFAALADPTRLRLLNLMNGREVCVCYFVEILGQSQPKISRHLAYLRKAGIVAARRDGKWMHYRIVTPRHEGAAKLLSEMLAVLREEKAMQAELAQFQKACCAPKRSAALDGAPVPVPISGEACSA